MLVELTYACKMGCSHCMSDCKPDGEHMSLQILKDTLEFMINHQILTTMRLRIYRKSTENAASSFR